MEQLLEPVIHAFDPISLVEMENVELMNRVDTKFTFSRSSLPVILKELADFYWMLEVNGERKCHYENLYFDTPGLLLYLQHHNGKQNRYKVRYRRYADSDTCFFEVKFKNNKSRTIKNRLKRDKIEDEIHGKAEKLLQRESGICATDLCPAVWVYYRRMTLVNKCNKERCTVDIDLRFVKDDAVFSYPELVIAEVKQDKCCKSPFINLMKLKHIRSSAISKYCFGIINTQKSIKANSFKSKLNEINKICHA